MASKLSAEERLQLRSDAFALLDDQLPSELVRELQVVPNRRRRLAWIAGEEPGTYTAQLEPVPEVEPGRLSEMVGLYFDNVEFENKFAGWAQLRRLEKPTSLSEVIACRLRQELVKLRKFERDARVRRGGVLPRSVISRVAQELVEEHAALETPPGPHLCALLGDLLSAGWSSGSDTKSAEKAQAVFLVALKGAGPRSLAKELGVSTSTAHQWMQEGAFKKRVEQVRSFYEASNRDQRPHRRAK